MYGRLFESDDYISDVVRSCRGFREFVKNEILKGVGGASSSSGVNEDNEPIQYIGTKKVLIQGTVLTFIDKVFWLTYHIERFVIRNTPVKSRYPDLKSAVASIPGGRFNSNECIGLADEAISFFAKYDEDLAGNNKALMALNDIRYDNFEEFIKTTADNMCDYTGKADASYITDAVYDYRVQVIKRFPNAEFDVSMDVFEKVLMTLQRIINNLYNPALVDIIEKEQWV